MVAYRRKRKASFDHEAWMERRDRKRYSGLYAIKAQLDQVMRYIRGSSDIQVAGADALMRYAEAPSAARKWVPQGIRAAHKYLSYRKRYSGRKSTAMTRWSPKAIGEYTDYTAPTKQYLGTGDKGQQIDFYDWYKKNAKVYRMRKALGRTSGRTYGRKGKGPRAGVFSRPKGKKGGNRSF